MIVYGILKSIETKCPDIFSRRFYYSHSFFLYFKTDSKRQMLTSVQYVQLKETKRIHGKRI